MRNATWDQRTVLQTHDPANGDRYVPVAKLEGVSLPLDPAMSLTIDGDRWHAAGRRTVTIDTYTRTVVTTVTVVRDDS